MKSWLRLHRSILDSSLMEQPEHVQLVFFKLLALADWNGEIRIAERMLRRRLYERSIELVRDAISVLSSPDAHSRSPEEEGRRIVPLDDAPGWRIVNWERYQGRPKASEDPDYERDRKRSLRARARLKSGEEEEENQKEIEIEVPGRPGTSRDTSGQKPRKKRAKREGDARLVKPEDDLVELGLAWPESLLALGLQEAHLRMRIRRQVEEQGKPKTVGAWKAELATVAKAMTFCDEDVVLETLQASVDRGWQGIQLKFFTERGVPGPRRMDAWERLRLENQSIMGK